MRALVAILAAAFTLRIGILVVGPVIEDIRADTGMSSAAAGMLGTIPFLCMGLFAFAGVPLVRRLGPQRLVAAALVVIAVATVARAVMPTGALIIAATVPLGAGIALAGTALPGIVNQHFPHRGGAVTGAYVAALSIGGAGAAFMMVPLADVFGSWRMAFALSALPTAVAVPLWLLAVGRVRPPEPVAAGPWRPWREALAPSRLVLILAAVFGFQSMCFAAMVSWVAALYQEAGWSAESAGAAAAAIPLTTIPAALVVAGLSDRGDRRLWLFGCAALMTAGMLGLAFAPLALPLLWLVAFGVGAGAVFAIALALPIDLGHDALEVTRLTAGMLGLGFLLSALGPVIVGALRDLTGGFTVPVALVGLLGMLSGVLGLAPDLRRTGPAGGRPAAHAEAPFP